MTGRQLPTCSRGSGSGSVLCSLALGRPWASLSLSMPPSLSPISLSLSVSSGSTDAAVGSTLPAMRRDWRTGAGAAASGGGCTATRVEDAQQQASFPAVRLPFTSEIQYQQVVEAQFPLLLPSLQLGGASAVAVTPCAERSTVYTDGLGMYNGMRGWNVVCRRHKSPTCFRFLLGFGAGAGSGGGGGGGPSSSRVGPRCSAELTSGSLRVSKPRG